MINGIGLSFLHVATKISPSDKSRIELRLVSMKLSKDNLNDEVIIHFKDAEYSMLIGALRAAASDDVRKGIAFVNFYGSERGDVVRLSNAVQNAEENSTP